MITSSIQNNYEIGLKVDTMKSQVLKKIEFFKWGELMQEKFKFTKKATLSLFNLDIDL